MKYGSAFRLARKNMNRKSIIICLSVTAVFIVLITIALSILYSGQGKERASSLYDSREYGLMSAVPADAVYVLKTADFSDCLDILSPESSVLGMLIGTKTRESAFMSFIDSLSATPDIIPDVTAVISGHHIGTITPLLIMDAGRAGDAPNGKIEAVSEIAAQKGLFTAYVDVSESTRNSSYLKKRSVLMVSPSDILIQSSERHLKRGISIIDSEGVTEAVESVSSKNILVFPSAGFKKTVTENMDRRFRSKAEFLAGFSDCVAFDIISCTDGELSLCGSPASGENPQYFTNVYNEVRSSSSKVSDMIPSYTVFAASLPMDDVAAYNSAYMKFAGTRSLFRKLEEERKQLLRKTGTDPVSWAKGIDIEEVAVSAFNVGRSLEKILLIRVGHEDRQLIFKDMDKDAVKSYDGGILSYPYEGFTSVLFGELFSLRDERNFIFRDGWIIVGSRAALEEYVSGRAEEYTLSEYISDAGLKNGLAGKDTYFAAYYSVSEFPRMADSLFSDSFSAALQQSLDGISYEPVFLSVCDGKTGLNVLVDMDREVVLKSKAPEFERDTTVVIPSGPFRVKNSGTGRMNLFYQQKNMYLCLQEENGKGIWGVPFKTPICGCAQTVDYFANGKLQILFASGSKLYLIDRLGRFVNPFPVDLGKEILIGPDVYDFAGKRKYNVMILHKDNTVEMYNLQGRKPDGWKGIAPSETITSMPERIDFGSDTYWIVRTSIQTLIYDFYGGEPLTKFEGDRMIRSDSKVVSAGDHTVEVTCYDGRQHRIKL